jgi:peptide deformylase
MLELGHPLLRNTAARVELPLSQEIQELIGDLRDTLRDFRARSGWGRALGAPVVGESLRVVVIEYDNTSLTLINPRFEQWSNDQIDDYESCMTFPAIWGCVSRPRSVVVLAWDETGAEQRIEASGDLARILQHELDHLDGLTWLDRDPDLGSICTTKEYRRQFQHQ